MPDVLYLDNHLLVVCKPAGMLSQGDRTGDPSVLDWGKAFLKEQFNKPGDVYLGLVHRLDRPASGVLALARTSKAARRLTEQFKRRLPDKRYLALAEGLMEPWGVCEGYVAKANEQVRVVAADHPGARWASLRWRSVALGTGLTLVEVALETGRPHQIRVQLAHLGHPILGDFRYGARRPFDGRNLALHCYRLTLEHPTRRTPATFTARPPGTWTSHFHGEIEALFADLAGHDDSSPVDA